MANDFEDTCAIDPCVKLVDTHLDETTRFQSL